MNKCCPPLGGEAPAHPQIQIFTRFRSWWRQFDVSEGQVKDFGASQTISPYVNDVTVQGWSWIWSLLLCLQSAWWYMQKFALMSQKEKIWLLRGVAVAWLTAVLWYLSWVYGTRFLSLLALWVESSDVSSSCQFYNVSSFLMTCPFYQKSARSRRGRRTQNSSLQCRKLAQIKFERASLTFPGTTNVRTEWTIETVVLFAPLQQQ